MVKTKEESGEMNTWQVLNTGLFCVYLIYMSYMKLIFMILGFIGFWYISEYKIRINSLPH